MQDGPRSWLKTVPAPVWRMLIGALVGFAIGMFVHNPIKEPLQQVVFYALIGALVGVTARPAFEATRSWLRPLGIEELPIPVPGIGVVSISLGNPQRLVGRRIFIEIVTRIVTQRLEARTGTIREALNSLYGLFQIVRDELKEMPPSRPPATPQGGTIEYLAIRMLNDAIRPHLARWHPRLGHWEAGGMPESKWPLAEACRNDLETMRCEVIEYGRSLGKLLRIPKLDELIPEPPDFDATEIAKRTDEALREWDPKLAPTLPDAHAAVGWRIFVELASRISTQPLEQESGSLREALTSLHQLFERVRAELKRMSPTPPTGDSEPTVEQLVLRILNRGLRPFLAEWHPRLQQWEDQDKNEREWADASACREALERVREEVCADARRLGQMVGVENMDAILATSAHSGEER